MVTCLDTHFFSCWLVFFSVDGNHKGECIRSIVIDQCVNCRDRDRLTLFKIGLSGNLKVAANNISSWHAKQRATQAGKQTQTHYTCICSLTALCFTKAGSAMLFGQCSSSGDGHVHSPSLSLSLFLSLSFCFCFTVGVHISHKATCSPIVRIRANNCH